MAAIFCDINHLNTSTLLTKMKLWKPLIKVTTEVENNIQTLYLSKSRSGLIDDYAWNETFQFFTGAADDIKFSICNLWGSSVFGSGTVRIPAIGDLPLTVVVPITRKGKEVAYLSVLFKSGAEFNRVEQPAEASTLLADAANIASFADHVRRLFCA